jgi:hypothetical protein
VPEHHGSGDAPRVAFEETRGDRPRPIVLPAMQRDKAQVAYGCIDAERVAQL